MKKIPLTKNKFALVDDEDYERLNRFKWHALDSRGTHYAVRNRPTKNGKRGPIRMHRDILNLKLGDKRQADHIDGNGLDNRKSNLRICNNRQNCQNRKPRQGTSRFKGVSFHCRKDRPNWKRWLTQIQINGKNKHVGYYKDEVRAAMAYDEIALKAFGEFARLNFPDGVIIEEEPK